MNAVSPAEVPPPTVGGTEDTVSVWGGAGLRGWTQGRSGPASSLADPLHSEPGWVCPGLLMSIRRRQEMESAEFTGEIGLLEKRQAKTVQTDF